MNVAEALAAFDSVRSGDRMHELMTELFPICRSITGDGFRQSLGIVGKRIPLDVHEVPTGTQAFDWTVPKEWNIRDAYVADATGERLVDFRESNLHVVNYSVPVRARMPLQELLPHLNAIPEHRDWIPYRTSYYAPSWGFCLTQRQLDGLVEGEYEVVVDSTLEDGSLTYGECYLEGETDEEVLITCHGCHPSLANDNLSGVVLVAALAELLGPLERRYSYRLLFIPGTIGSITWLSRNEAVVPRVRHGLVAACVGDPGPLTYKRTRHGTATVDRAATHVVAHRGGQVRDFSPYGYDERQFNSPGFDMPVGCLSRTPHGEFPEYHTSADNLEFVRPEQLADSLAAYLEVLDILEGDRAYVNLSPKGEPQLGKRGLYPSMGGKRAEDEVLAMLWVLNQSDGDHTLLDVAERSGLSFGAIREAADKLLAGGLLSPVPQL